MRQEIWGKNVFDSRSWSVWKATCVYEGDCTHIAASLHFARSCQSSSYYPKQSIQVWNSQNGIDPLSVDQLSVQWVALLKAQGTDIHSTHRHHTLLSTTMSSKIPYYICIHRNTNVKIIVSRTSHLSLVHNTPIWVNSLNFPICVHFFCQGWWIQKKLLRASQQQVEVVMEIMVQPTWWPWTKEATINMTPHTGTPSDLLCMMSTPISKIHHTGHFVRDQLERVRANHPVPQPNNSFVY